MKPAGQWPVAHSVRGQSGGIHSSLFQDGEYLQRLSNTSVLLLPYRLSAYRLRGSRVAIEVMVNGIPLVAMRGTTLAEKAGAIRRVSLLRGENVESLMKAIETVERNYEALVVKALNGGIGTGTVPVENFRCILKGQKE